MIISRLTPVSRTSVVVGLLETTEVNVPSDSYAPRIRKRRRVQKILCRTACVLVTGETIILHGEISMVSYARRKLQNVDCPNQVSDEIGFDGLQPAYLQMQS